MNQRHFATVTKDRTGKFQDETIEKPGEEFGAALHDWLAGGTLEKRVEKLPPKSKSVSDKAKTGKTADKAKLSLREQGDRVITEIGNIFNASKNGVKYFSEEEKEEARQIIRDTKPDENGLTDLNEFKKFLSDELAKRESKNAA